ncbi:hypothetical protein C8F04DRAFT_1264846 [Mycena alexandri]|uniref:NACHT domain-containing protein n=1 Tax=Mycena alexandri TaxID=1745969 RepID=A0AAD6SMC4_9AGAR|nr:hypothetical protein C8F04DRAFT_1264846 [Mycena alexandri]
MDIPQASGFELTDDKREGAYGPQSLTRINGLRCAKDVGPGESKECLQDTRVALLSHLEDWALCPTTERAMLLHGAAGRGKSAIVHTIARKLESAGFAVVPFFGFSCLVPDRSLSQLIPTWAEHLAQLIPQYRLYLNTLLPRQLETSDILDQREALLMKGLASAVDDGRPLIFTIDALDECPPGEAVQLFHVLRELLSSPSLPPSVRFLLTCRPNEEISHAFTGLPMRHISIDNEEGTAEDIRKFVHDKLYRNNDVADMVDDVAKVAQMSFECAAVLCRELTATQRPASQSKRRDFIRSLREGPVMSLYDSYHAILAMYFNKEEDAELIELFRHVMGWIFLVRTPQPRRVFRAFAAALAEQSDVDQILSWPSSLLCGTTSENDPISPLHTSLRDFLLDATASGMFSVDLGPDSQEELSLACLRIMNTGLQFNICGLSKLFVLNSEITELARNVKKSISPELRYACVATAKHLRSTVPPRQSIVTSRDPPRKEVIDEVRFFFEHQFLFWLEAHSFMQTVWNEPGIMLPLFLEWAMAREEKAIENIVQDYIKFEKRFRSGYMKSAPQIYISGLLFAPRESVISSLYRPLFRNLIQATGDLDVVWPRSETLVLQVMSDVLAVAFSPDGTRIASGCLDKTLRVWDVAMGHPIGNPLAGHTGSVLSVVFSPDGSRIASGSADKTVRVWDVATGHPIGKPLAGHTSWVQSVVFSPDSMHIASGSDDTTIRVWDAETGNPIGEPLAGHTNWVSSVAFTPDGTRIASGSADKTVRMWDAATGSDVRAWLGPETRAWAWLDRAWAR